MPQVGIFWRIRTEAAGAILLVDSVPIASAESYGEFLTYGGHYEFWSEMANMSAAELRRRGLPDVAHWSEYEEWPRGRTVFHVPTNRFIIYVDQKLTAQPIVAQLAHRFCIPTGSFNVRGDPHYVSVR